MHRSGRARPAWFRVLGTTAAFVLVVTGCDRTGAIDTEQAVDASTYAAVIARFVPSPAGAETPPVAFVTPVGDDTLTLEDQIAVIDALAESHDVRFVDDASAVYDPTLPDSPPKDEGVLVGVGRISGESPHTVRVEVYASAHEIDAQLVTISWRSDEWRIDSVEPVEPEVLVGDE